MVISSQRRRRDCASAVRGRIPAVFRATEVYVQTCIMALHVRLSSVDLEPASKRLGVMVGVVCRGILRSDDTGAVLHTRVMREAIERIGNSPLHNDQRSYLTGISSSATVGHFGVYIVHLSAAKAGAGGTKQGAGKPVKVHETSLNLAPVVTYWHILGKDAAGNYWVMMKPRGLERS